MIGHEPCRGMRCNGTLLPWRLSGSSPLPGDGDGWPWAPMAVGAGAGRAVLWCPEDRCRWSGAGLSI